MPRNACPLAHEIRSDCRSDSDNLRTLGADLHVLTENSYASIQVTHAPRDVKVIYANKAFKTLTGYDPHEVIVKTATGNDWNPL